MKTLPVYLDLEEVRFINIEDVPPLPTRQEMLDFLDMVPYWSHISVDTEGDFSLDPPLFLGYSLAFAPWGMYFPVAHLMEGNVDEDIVDISFKAVMQNRRRVFQHAGHDLIVLEEIGYDMWHLQNACTMIMAHMVNENTLSKDLDTLHKVYTGGTGKTRPEEMNTIIKGLGWRYVPPLLMNIYAKQDAIATSELYKALEPLYVAEFGELYA